MTDSEVPSTTHKKNEKPPTITVGVTGLNAFLHSGYEDAGETGPERVNWSQLVRLPSFELFVTEQSGHPAGNDADHWVMARRQAMSDSVLYELYAKWHKDKGWWAGESPMGGLL